MWFLNLLYFWTSKGNLRKLLCSLATSLHTLWGLCIAVFYELKYEIFQIINFIEVIYIHTKIQIISIKVNGFLQCEYTHLSCKPKISLLSKVASTLISKAIEGFVLYILSLKSCFFTQHCLCDLFELYLALVYLFAMICGIPL